MCSKTRWSQWKGFCWSLAFLLCSCSRKVFELGLCFKWPSYNKGVSGNSKNVKPQQWLFLLYMSWSHALLCQAQIQANLMGPGSQSCSVTWAELGRDTPGTDCTSLFSWQLERPTKQMREAEERLKAIPQFCFPDAKDWLPVSEYNRWVLQSCSPPWRDAGMMLECTGTASASSMPN